MKIITRDQTAEVERLTHQLQDANIFADNLVEHLIHQSQRMELLMQHIVAGKHEDIDTSLLLYTLSDMIDENECMTVDHKAGTVAP